MFINAVYPELGFFQINCHGFFKALIFIGSGLRIHSFSSRTQDIQKISPSKRNLFFKKVFHLGNLGLMRIPF